MIPKFWVIWDGTSGAVSKQHATREEAVKEAQRLHQKEFHKQKFYIMGCEGVFKKETPPISFEESGSGELTPETMRIENLSVGNLTVEPSRADISLFTGKDIG